MIDLFDRHKYGILGTLVAHTILLALLNLTTVNNHTFQRESLPIELIMEPDEPQQRIEQHNEEAPANQPVTNLPSNITATVQEALSKAQRERMAERVERDLHQLEQEEFERLAQERAAAGKKITVPELDPSKFDKSNYMEEKEKPVKVEGLTTVSYDLKGRYHRVLDVPAYLCKGSGKVVVRVSVDRPGNVIKAEIDPAQSTTTTGCMAEHAISSARQARFNAAPIQQQRGTITYVFLPQ